MTQDNKYYKIIFPFSICILERMKKRPTKRFFQSLVSNNGFHNFTIIKNRFPVDAKVVDVRKDVESELVYVTVESEKYSLESIDNCPIFSNFDINKKEKVQFT